jgi:hypothetical protein
MGDRQSVVMHYNPRLRHQVEHAQAFAVAGIRTTTDPRAPADVHIVSGPHYALPYWRNHSQVIWLDRAYWGDPKYVSLGALEPDGSRVFLSPQGERQKPELQPWGEAEDSALVLLDYNQDIKLAKLAKRHFRNVCIRRHPVNEVPIMPLRDQIAMYDVAVGTSSTALVDAVIAGKPVICYQTTSPVAPVASEFGNIKRPRREAWLDMLSWRQFTLEEIAAGWPLEMLGL